MQIRNAEKLKKDGFLTIEDLDCGDVFKFLDNKELLMLVDNDYIMSVSTGEFLNDTNDNFWEDRPVRKVKAYVVIEE